MAVVKPLFKKGKVSEIDNYRPISILPSFSKIFEIIICYRVSDFMLHNNIFSPTQHGFLKGRSTQTAMFAFIQNIFNAFEKRELALGLFLDLSKAYDTIDYQLLITKLYQYGVRGPTLNWFRSYLSERAQKVSITKNGSNFESSSRVTRLGIPQGSIVGCFS